MPNSRRRTANAAGPLAVGAIATLAVLREAGVLANRREAQTIFYRIADPAAVKVIETSPPPFSAPTSPPERRNRMTALTPIDAQSLARKLKLRELTLIDIREPDEYAREHIDGAVSSRSRA